MEDAVTHLTIMFLGNFGELYVQRMSSVLRALGDSVIPLLILVAASLTNVGLDLFFCPKLWHGRCRSCSGNGAFPAFYFGNSFVLSMFYKASYAQI